MCKCFCCGKEITDEEIVHIPSLRIVICRECEQSSLEGRRTFSLPDYAKSWTRAEWSRKSRAR
jgi:hypothetical protein